MPSQMKCLLGPQIESYEKPTQQVKESLDITFSFRSCISTSQMWIELEHNEISHTETSEISKMRGWKKKSWMVCTWNRISICIHFDYAAEKNISILVMEWNLIILSEFLSRSLIFWMLARFPGSLGLRNEEWSANWIRCGQFNYEPATIILIFRGKIAKATQFAISLIRVNFQNLPSNLILMETRQTWFVMHLDSIAFWQRFQKKLSHLPRVTNKHKNVW